MLRIAICDDEQSMIDFHAQTVKACLSETGIVGEIQTYVNGKNLLCDVSEDHFHYDLILLDIEMPEISGMDLARQLRPFLPNVKMIFITSHVEFAIDAYELSIFRYVPKNDLEKRLPGAITDAIKLLSLEADKVYTIQTNSRLERIPFRDILYVSKDGKNALITTGTGTSQVRKPLQQVFDELNAEEFLFIDRGCIVNLIHVMQIKDGCAILKDGTALPVSRSHLQDVKEKINAYWGAHL